MGYYFSNNFIEKEPYYNNSLNFFYDSTNKKNETPIQQDSKSQQNWGKVINEFKEIARKYEYLLENEDKIPEDSPVWVMWYQGIKNAPSLVKACIQSIIENSGNHPVHIVDKTNYEEFVSLPPFVLEKLNNKKISVTHFSDILRAALLKKYGGFWIDSTYLITTPFNIAHNYSLFSLKCLMKYCTMPSLKCQWAINFLACNKNSFLPTYLFDAFLAYFNTYDTFNQYFLLDSMINVAYKTVEKFKSLFDKLPYIECNIFRLASKLNKTDDNYPLDTCAYNKLTWKKNYTLIKDSKPTIYSRILDKYKYNSDGELPVTNKFHFFK